MVQRNYIVSIGNIYLETNYLGLKTGNINFLEIGKEYRAPAYELRIGGSAANFAKQIVQLGGKVGLIGKIGTDNTGRLLLELLHESKIFTDLIKVSNDPEIHTCVDSGLVLDHNGQNIQVVAGNANQKLELSDIDFSNQFFQNISCAYVSGFVKQEMLYTDYPQILEVFRNKKITVFFDHGRIPVDFSDDMKRTLLSCFQYVTGYLPNIDELMAVSGQKDIVKAARWIIEQGTQFVVVKKGADGCTYVDKNGVYDVSGLPVKPTSTVGAGDVFNAAYILQYMQGADKKKGLEFANAAAVYKVGYNRNPNIRNVSDTIEMYDKR